MNHKKISIISILLAVAIGLSACASPVTPAATPESQVVSPISQAAAPVAQACPTLEPQSCPTAALQGPVLNEWRWDISKNVEFVITFDAGDKCSIEAVDRYDGTDIAYEIVVNDQTYQNYMVAVLSLDEGKKYEDLLAYNEESGGKLRNPPPWSELEAIEVVSPMSRTVHTPMIDTAPLYFACIIQGPDEPRVIGALEGIPIPEY